ncbi:hypothetical protein PPERSA_11944 [Pseudocohnilembus persalinus]|uniref:Uncharacterized protein n=1 Tax=Pseudocohnilembus persalinus TaxID=266149 RepID=A0A0V0QKE4_PSEPJ|nr:hypothetical protein PPERSA_11944 [Pseudocohnilembus persalinus]|eukprot:KRX02604.1 hypothetical protein PPERSA_11944 [Pseudocohnilembus persalinus]
MNAISSPSIGIQQIPLKFKSLEVINNGHLLKQKKNQLQNLQQNSDLHKSQLNQQTNFNEKLEKQRLSNYIYKKQLRKSSDITNSCSSKIQHSINMLQANEKLKEENWVQTNRDNESQDIENQTKFKEKKNYLEKQLSMNMYTDKIESEKNQSPANIDTFDHIQDEDICIPNENKFITEGQQSQIQCKPINDYKYLQQFQSNHLITQ